MRVNQPQNRMNQQRMKQGNNNSQSQINTLSNTQRTVYHETAVMQLARKIKNEQGARPAGYFLFAVKPFVAPNEINHIERELNIKSECDPSQIQRPRTEGGGGNTMPPMMQIMMNMMRNKGKLDPMSLMKMMNNKPN